ncbi:MAG: hypothetical protein CVV22_08085 [Ignavibacteriae bacterium HGW-Ignavibacteriae-1]|jgi:hypothetical protein|nr:MAG: hypothetical protein CVV22_08085 [Ignavibacteriae bacterium HGW-Ignavibacteriae-1]
MVGFFIKYSVLLILSFLVFLSCSETGVNNGDNAKEILPLKIGNSWNSNIYTYRSSDKDSVRLFDSSVMVVTDKVTLKGEDWFFLEVDGKLTKQVWSNRKDGLWVIAFKDQTLINVDSAKLAIKYPTKLNEIYPITPPSGITVSLNSEVVTLAGTFNCIRYSDIEYASHEFYGVYYFPGIGLIKQERITLIHENPPDTSWIRTILTSYDIK